MLSDGQSFSHTVLQLVIQLCYLIDGYSVGLSVSQPFMPSDRQSVRQDSPSVSHPFMLSDGWFFNQPGKSLVTPTVTISDGQSASQSYRLSVTQPKCSQMASQSDRTVFQLVIPLCFLRTVIQSDCTVLHSVVSPPIILSEG